MNRKTKIVSAVTAILGAIGAGSLFWRSTDEAVQVAFLGPSTKNPSLLSFALANKGTNSLRVFVGFRVLTNGSWTYGNAAAEGVFQTIEPRSSSLFDTGIMSTNRWKVVVRYTDPVTFNALDRARMKGGEYAIKKGWMRVARWLLPVNKVKRIFGPEMLGHQLAPPAER